MPRSPDPLVDTALAASFLAAFPPDILARLLADAGRYAIPAGTTMQGDPRAPARLSLVLAGLSRLYLMSPEGRQVTVRYLRPGDVVGTAAFVAGPSPVIFQVLTDSILLSFNIPAFREIARTNATVALLLAKEVGERLFDTLDVVAGTAFASIRERVAYHLLEIAASRQEGATLVVAVTQQELADAVGSVREVIARVLRELRMEGLIATRAGDIALLDPDRLYRAAWTRDAA